MLLLVKHTADLRDAVNVLFAARQRGAMMLVPVQSVWKQRACKVRQHKYKAMHGSLQQ